MRGDETKRRYRVRRKRRGETIADGTDAVEFGCCLVEAMSVVATLAGLVLVPLILLG